MSWLRIEARSTSIRDNSGGCQEINPFYDLKHHQDL
jgi:hypothetical protein